MSLVEFAMPLDPPYVRNVYIASLPPTYTDEELRNLFSPFGKIVSTALVKDKRTGLCKGYGFVLMENFQDSYNAVMALQGHVIAHTRVQVRFARPEASVKKANSFLYPQTFVCGPKPSTMLVMYPQPYVLTQ
ncbi:putative RNA recognition motif (a k a RRM RBD or RNP domain) [Trypanosoma vivax]|uniref:Putative RNA-binding protein n=1 Tax=Trypanosoma vivax (strain Y486) TaxID=1055687 RepID=G0UDB0_TRYVY|nr:putative RNA-binding protein [Trypanosoma vivax]KAH8605160.1 putative RNA recognition motif (a k a RRM RBD or RNP domain) [Trypanosoma vivax]CCC53821.1 putative RNA-binding protein [Trypanosoma vivax Y486]